MIKINSETNKGITLVALVITIIILLILAGITINSLTGSELFEKTKQASEKSQKAEGEELLRTKIYSYQIYAVDKNEETTLEGLKEYLKNDAEIEYIDLYIGTDENMNPIQEGEKATHAKVKLKKYKYEYVLNKQLEVVGENKKEEVKLDFGKVRLDSELEKLLKEANMTITLEDILNTPVIMDNIEGLIPTIAESDIKTRTEENGIVEYTTNDNEKIRTNSEYGVDTAGTYYAWQAFDRIDTDDCFAISKHDEAEGYYLEYEFTQKVYAMKIDFKATNDSSMEGTRVLQIQGYDEEKNEWLDLVNDDITVTGIGGGTKSTFPLVKEKLNYAKPYKKYRIFVKSATYTSHINGARLSGVREMQLYGAKVSNENNNSEEEIKKALLSNYKLEKITLEQMATNKEFIKRLIDALSVETVESNAILMGNLTELIVKLSENDVTRKEENGVIEYTTSKGEKIRTNSEHSSGNYQGWQAFDRDTNTCTLSNDYTADKYYIEYEFLQYVYAIKIKFNFASGSNYEGIRNIIIQGYNEQINNWENVSEEIIWTRSIDGKNEKNENLNSSKAYKKYRIYVESPTIDEAGYCHSGLYEMQLYGKQAK